MTPPTERGSNRDYNRSDGTEREAALPDDPAAASASRANPTERPEEREARLRKQMVDFGEPIEEKREGAVPDQAVPGDESVAAGSRAAQEPSSRPTDSLALVEERLAKQYAVPGMTFGDAFYAALADLRTLINEVKERDEKLAELEPYNERRTRGRTSS